MGENILFLCTGNTCRSPLAEVLAADIFAGSEYGFISAGLDAVAGNKASSESIKVAANWNLLLDDFESSPITTTALDQATWVIGMTRSHAAIFRSRYSVVYQGRIGVLGAPGVDLSGVTYSEPVEEVDDPFGCAQEFYQATGEQIRQLLIQWRSVFE